MTGGLQSDAAGHLCTNIFWGNALLPYEQAWTDGDGGGGGDGIDGDDHGIMIIVDGDDDAGDDDIFVIMMVMLVARTLNSSSECFVHSPVF